VLPAESSCNRTTPSHHACSDGCLPAVKSLAAGAAGAADASGAGSSTAAAACSTLRALQLTDLTDQLAGKPGLWQALGQLTQLTRVELGMRQHVVAVSVERMRAVRALPALRALALGNIGRAKDDKDGALQPQLQLQLLAELTALQRLQLCAGFEAWQPVLGALGGLTQLTSLQLAQGASYYTGCRCPDQADLSSLPASLVELELDERMQPTGWGALPQLRHLVAPQGL
jgi:hypothetical protein